VSVGPRAGIRALREWADARYCAVMLGMMCLELLLLTVLVVVEILDCARR